MEVLPCMLWKPLRTKVRCSLNEHFSVPVYNSENEELSNQVLRKSIDVFQKQKGLLKGLEKEEI